jgi:hypothetical protein
MSQRARTLSLVVAAAAILPFAPISARADMTKAQCIESNTTGQDLRREGKLSAAREQFRACALPACPGILRDDCARRLDELDKAQPTIAFEVKDASGADTVAVKVTVDGKPLAERLDGSALRVDIGQHVFTFLIAGQPPITRTLVLTEGEKGRHERVVIAGETPPASMPSAGGAPSPASPRSASVGSAGASATESGGMGTQKVLGLVAGGVGVAGVAVGGVFGTMAFSEKSREQSDCASSLCSPGGHARAIHDRSAGMTDSTISTVGFAAGGALVVGGAILFFTGGRSTEPQSTTGLLVAPSVGPGSAGVSFGGAF